MELKENQVQAFKDHYRIVRGILQERAGAILNRVKSIRKLKTYSDKYDGAFRSASFSGLLLELKQLKSEYEIIRAIVQDDDMKFSLLTNTELDLIIRLQNGVY